MTRSDAEEAFKVWVGQFGRKDWKVQYKNLLSAQREVRAEREYACRTGRPTPATLVEANEASVPEILVSPASVTLSTSTRDNAALRSRWAARELRSTITCTRRTGPGDGP